MVSDGDGGVVIAFSPCDGNLCIHRIGGNYLLGEGFDLGVFGQWSAVMPRPPEVFEERTAPGAVSVRAQVRRYEAPLTSMMAPVQNSEPSAARKSTAWATSSGRATRPSGL